MRKKSEIIVITVNVDWRIHWVCWCGIGQGISEVGCNLDLLRKTSVYVRMSDRDYLILRMTGRTIAKNKIVGRDVKCVDLSFHIIRQVIQL